jgi:hypothetical protein
VWINGSDELSEVVGWDHRGDVSVSVRVRDWDKYTVVKPYSQYAFVSLLTFSGFELNQVFHSG